jgi:hypothetical protein
MMNLNGMISIAMMRSLLFVVLTTLNLFAEGEPKMPMLNWMGREKAMRPTRTKRFMFNLAVNKSLYGRQGVDRCLYIVNYKN